MIDCSAKAGLSFDVNGDDLIASIAHEGCYVFGCGFVATMFSKALEAHNLESRIASYLVSSPADDQLFNGVRVLSCFDESLDHGALVCVAVHESIAEEVKNLLEGQGFTRIVWVYPHLYRLIYGEPLAQQVEVPIKLILERQHAEYHWLAVRSLAAETMMGELDDADDEVRDLYLKAQMLHCDRETACKRFDQLKALVRSMSSAGFDPAFPLLVDTDLKIIDGLHRLVVAHMLGMRAVPCNIVANSELYDQLLGDKNKITSAVLAQLDLTESQQAKIASRQRELVPRASEPTISVILPAYNVADYIDQCMESIAAQSYGDFEVLLINDGSTDATAEKCLKWEREDSRINFINKGNEGVSPTRNLGIELASGAYLAFVDPDDWLDERYLELLHNTAVSEQALLVECDLWRYDNRTGKKIMRHCGGRMGVRYNLEEHMKYAPTASYKAISRRSLWVDNDIRFPSCSFESPAIYALVVALAGDRCAYVAEPLYYYRRFRENSLVETAYAKSPGVADNTLGVEAMRYLVGQFKVHGMYERYRNVLPELVVYRLNDILAMQYHRRSNEDFAALVENQRRFVTEEFSPAAGSAYITWGGYNLNKIMQHAPMLNDPSCRFNFSSIIAVADTDPGARADVVVNHANRYRQMMVKRELAGAYWDVLEQKQPAFIVMDLIDERFDVIEDEQGHITASDAFEGAEVKGLKLGNRIPFGTACHRELWERSFDRFVERTREASNGTRIIVVENYLSEHVGTLAEKRLFANVDEIRKSNDVLSQYYSHIRSRYPSIPIVRASEEEGYFTDEDFEYGALPQHLNDIVNQRIAHKVYGEIENIAQA